MSFLLTIGRSGGWYHSFTRTAWRICLGPVALTLVFHDLDAVLSAALITQEVRRGATHQ